ncbi:MAG: hypothetical protein LBV04_01360 [Deferribacteraceae bacterium]|jgi:hypothetical protein|nr:hypothetical protein [Deferribacteraceae bacterium]
MEVREVKFLGKNVELALESDEDINALQELYADFEKAMGKAEMSELMGYVASEFDAIYRDGDDEAAEALKKELKLAKIYIADPELIADAAYIDDEDEDDDETENSLMLTFVAKSMPQVEIMITLNSNYQMCKLWIEEEYEL